MGSVEREAADVAVGQVDLSDLSIGETSRYHGPDGSDGRPDGLQDQHNGVSTLPDPLTDEASTAASSSKTVDSANPPPARRLTGQQEHYLKRELIFQQVQIEMGELASPMALKRFGLPFRSEKGDIPASESDFPLFRYVFVNHIQTFPFIDKAKEKDFWQDKLQVFLESFANKRISSCEDRLEMTKRRKLAMKAEKVLEMMMVSALQTASGYEEPIRFAELEVVDRSANSHSLVANSLPGHRIHGWDVNVAGVRIESVRRHIRYHTHATFLVQVVQPDESAIDIGCTYADFAQLRRNIQVEFPGMPVPVLPRKNKEDETVFGLPDGTGGADGEADLDDSSESVFGTVEEDRLGVRTRHERKMSSSSFASRTSFRSSRRSRDSGLDPGRDPGHMPRVLPREAQRISLRAFLRVLLQRERLAKSKSMAEFLTSNPITLTPADREDIRVRKRADEIRLREHQEFYESAQRQAAELDREMEKFRRDVVHGDGIENLFKALKEKERIADLDEQHQTFAKWLRLEVAATLYHVFLAEDNSAELFAQAKQIHKYIPYQLLSTIIRFASPAAVMHGVVDVFLRQPLGSRSLLERIVEYALQGSITTITNNLKTLEATLANPALCERVRNYIQADEEIKTVIRSLAEDEHVDLLALVVKVESGLLQPDLDRDLVDRVVAAHDGWASSENPKADEKGGSQADVEFFAHLKHFYKLAVRLRDKEMMLSLIRDEPATIPLFRDLFNIFYHPLVLVYRTANVYNSVNDFARFVDDTIRVVEKAQRDGLSADPNQTVQSFITLCETHQDSLYKFLHEIYRNDSDLFTSLRLWFEDVLNFLRHGPKSRVKLDMHAFVDQAIEDGLVGEEAMLAEVNSLIKWQMARKRWHQSKTKQKMAADRRNDKDEEEEDTTIVDEDDDQESDGDSGPDEHDGGDHDRRRRERRLEQLRRRAGEPEKPEVVELTKLLPRFVEMLRPVLAD